ncbi:Rne/Rng family ribonuclease [Bifidobacterium favimelis]|uniref:Rne/Rng family ribonuclease n=1 Tax=Bifidobacterium favimelis TaxID=3122979 RepID=A0ABU8ZLL7_9BIFI
MPSKDNEDPEVNGSSYTDSKRADTRSEQGRSGRAGAGEKAEPAPASGGDKGKEPPAPRRRSGRRVVRVAGAAGARVPVQVEAKEGARSDAPSETAKTSETGGAEEGAGEERSSKSSRPSSPSAGSSAGKTRTRTRSVRHSAAPDEGAEEGESAGRTRGGEGSEEGASGKETSTSRSATRRRSRHVVAAVPDFEEPEQATRRSSASSLRKSAKAGDTDPDDRQERALEAVESLGAGQGGPASSSRRPSARTVRPRVRPMTSLLFQEPVIPDVPASGSREDEDEGDEGSHARPSRSTRRTRSQHGRSRHESEEDVSSDSGEEEEQEETSTQGRSRHSRRLNAQERRAAAEVEQIEEDLRQEGSPRDDDQEDSEDGQERSSRTVSRRRRSKSDREEEETEKTSTRRRRRTRDHEADEDDEEETALTRRRRRRRTSKGSDEEEAQPARQRSRKQQYIDEITDVEGSTRLEAKKQRRRDNRRERSRQSHMVEQDFLARREDVNRLMVVREKEHHTQISVIEDDILVEHYVSDIEEVSSVGNIYLGRIQNVLPSMEAAFVDIGQARNGVLYAGEVNWDSTRLEGQPRRIELAFRSGDPVLVQVTKDPIGHKGARLTSQVTLAGRFLVLVPSGGMTGVSRKLSDHERSRLKGIVSRVAPKDMGVIIRTAAEGASEEAITKDLENLQKQWEQIEAKHKEFLHGKRPKLLQGEPDVAIRVVRDIFNDDFSQLMVQGDRVYDRVENYLDTMAPDLKDKLVKWDPAEHQGKDVFDKWGIDSQLRKGMERQVYLPSGGSLVIDRTEAMTTIDVNTGRFIGKGKSLEETVTRCNLEASEEIARQLRLRDIGGMIMIDYVDMVMPANRDLVLRRLVECLARDRTKHQVAEVTSLGLVQMTRKRVGQGLVEAFSEECPTCHGRGFILHDEPTISASYDDPYAVKGGDPFVKTNKHGHGSAPKETVAKGSTPAVKAKLAQIAAAAQAAADDDGKPDGTSQEGVVEVVSDEA